jgi:hypothetical protein
MIQDLVVRAFRQGVTSSSTKSHQKILYSTIPTRMVRLAPPTFAGSERLQPCFMQCSSDCRYKVTGLSRSGSRVLHQSPETNEILRIRTRP